MDVRPRTDADSVTGVIEVIEPGKEMDLGTDMVEKSADGAIANRLDWAGLEKFVRTEAAYADANRYDEWLALWSADARYWVPLSDDADPKTHHNMIYDDRSKLEDRIHRLKSSHAHSQTPPSRMVRLLSNFRHSIEGDGEQSVADVEANFMLIEIRNGRQTLYGGTFCYRIGLEGGELKMRQKKVLLVQNSSVLGNLTFIL